MKESMTTIVLLVTVAATAATAATATTAATAATAGTDSTPPTAATTAGAISYGGSLMEHQSDRSRDQRTHDLWDVLNASARIFDYFKTYKTEMNFDALLGTRMAEDQYALLINEIGGGNKAPYDFDAIEFLRHLHGDIRTFNKKVLETMSKELPAEVVRSLGRMLEQDDSKIIPLVYQHLDNSSISYNEVDTENVLQGVEQLNLKYSTMCLREILTGEPSFNLNEGFNSSQCLISEWCWTTMTDKGFSGYSLTHQLFYFIIAMEAGCRNEIDNAIASKGGKPIEEMIRHFCSNILIEAQAIAEAGYPEMRQDIFMEQGTFCGHLGYDNFFPRTWVRQVLSWQRDIGCYGDVQLYDPIKQHNGSLINPLKPQDYVHYNPLKPQDGDRIIQKENSWNKHKRSKRAEKYMPEQCLAHRTGLALSYLAVALRMLILL